MKKEITIVAQPDKTETNSSEQTINQTRTQKMYRDHKVYDHRTHGRVNKFPFGSCNGPAFL